MGKNIRASRFAVFSFLLQCNIFVQIPNMQVIENINWILYGSHYSATRLRPVCDRFKSSKNKKEKTRSLVLGAGTHQA